MKSLNLFCDASTTKFGKSGDETVSAPGFIAVEEDERGEMREIHHEASVLRWSTNNKGELSAILMALGFIAIHQLEYGIINLYSDSRISLMTIRDWVFRWRIDKNFFFVKSDGKNAENQDIIRNIISLIVNNNIHVNLYHQKGHVDYLNDNDIYKAKELFCLSNGFKMEEISDLFIQRISYYNYLIDKYTRDILTPENIHGYLAGKRVIDFNVSREIMAQYRGLIENNRPRNT